MRKGRIPAWLTLMLAAVVLLFLAIPGLWVFVSVAATPRYPIAENVPTVAYSAPLPFRRGPATFQFPNGPHLCE